MLQTLKRTTRSTPLARYETNLARNDERYVQNASNGLHGTLQTVSMERFKRNADHFMKQHPLCERSAQNARFNFST